MIKFLDFKHWRGDVLGGITAGVVALPLALAFGVQSGLGASAGLYGAIFLGFFAALFGGTPTQISGPTAPMTAVSMLVIASVLSIFDGNLQAAFPLIVFIFFSAGLLQIVLGITGIGKFIKYIPYPVVSGFMTAIGVIILITQLAPVMGYKVSDDSEIINKNLEKAKHSILVKALNLEKEKGLFDENTIANITKEQSHLFHPDSVLKEAKSLVKSNSGTAWGTIKLLPRILKNINWTEFLIAISTIFIVLFGKKRIKKIPSTLIALLLVTIVCKLLNINYLKISEIPQGLPEFHIAGLFSFPVSTAMNYIASILTLTFLGTIDSLLTSVVADNLSKSRHNSNQELVGQGIGNSISALFGGIPGAGATIRTVVNINSGGKTKLSGLIAASLLFIILILLAPWASMIPAAVLAGILVTVGIGVMDYKGLRAIPKMEKSEVAIMLLVLLLSVFWDLILAVGIGLLISSLIFMKKMGEINSRQSEILALDEYKSKVANPRADEWEFPAHLVEEVFIKRLEGPLFFGFTSEFLKLAKEIPKTASHVLIRMGKVPYMDQSGLFAMEEVLLNLVDQNVTPMFVGLHGQPKVLFENIGIIPNLVKEEHNFLDFHEAMEYIVKNVPDKY